MSFSSRPWSTRRPAIDLTRPPNYGTLNRVLALKELGFTLHEIGDVLEAGISGDELLGMLRLRQADAERKADAERDRLNLVAARIRLLSDNETVDVGQAAVIVKPLEATRLAAVVKVIDDYDDVDFGVLIPQLVQRLVDETLRIGIRPPIESIQAHFPRRSDGRIDVIVGVPVQPDEEIESDHVGTLDIPAVGRAATIVHQGHFAEACLATKLLTEWLEATEQTVAFDHYREVYLQSQGPPETWVGEYQFILRDS